MDLLSSILRMLPCCRLFNCANIWEHFFRNKPPKKTTSELQTSTVLLLWVVGAAGAGYGGFVAVTATKGQLAPSALAGNKTKINDGFCAVAFVFMFCFLNAKH